MERDSRAKRDSRRPREPQPSEFLNYRKRLFKTALWFEGGALRVGNSQHRRGAGANPHWHFNCVHHGVYYTKTAAAGTAALQQVDGEAGEAERLVGDVGGCRRS